MSTECNRPQKPLTERKKKPNTQVTQAGVSIPQKPPTDKGKVAKLKQPKKNQ